MVNRSEKKTLVDIKKMHKKSTLAKYIFDSKTGVHNCCELFSIFN